MIMERLNRLLPLALSIALLLWVCDEATAQKGSAAKPIRLGLVASESGAFAVLKAGHQGAQLAVEEINKEGGVLGRPLELVVRDDKSNPGEATKVFRELTDIGVVAVIGSVPSGSAAAINPLALKQKTVFFPGEAYSRFLTEEQGNRYFFRVETNDRVFGQATVQYLAKQPFKRYCTIANDFAYGHSITDALVNGLKAKNPNVEVISGCQFWVPAGTQEFISQITAILSQKPDALIFAGVVAVSANAFVNQAKSFGLFDKVKGIHPTLAMPNNMWGLKKTDVPEGILTGSDYPYPPADTKASKQFFQAYQKRWNELPMESSATVYTVTRLVAKALQKAGKEDREALVDALKGSSIEHPVMGPITIRAIDNQSTAGWWFGYSSWDEEHGKLGLKDRWYEKADPYLPTEAEMAKLRAQK
jgi:branched-chain amino acid transport system substrate-binding protein